MFRMLMMYFGVITSLLLFAHILKTLVGIHAVSKRI